MNVKLTSSGKIWALLIPLLLSQTAQIHSQAPATCTPTYSTGCTAGDNIDDVTLIGATTTLSNMNTPCATTPVNGYADYTTSSTLGVPDLYPGQTYNGTVTTTYSSAYEYVTVWIDYDNNGAFATTEQVATFGPISVSSTGAYSFTVPASATPGIRRMRTMVVYNTAPTNACGTYTYGEAHDYRVLIGSNTPCTNPPVAGTTVASPTGQVCPGNTVSLSLNGITISSGQTYEWESSPNNTTYTSMGAAGILPGTNVSPLVTTWYRCKIVCSGGTPVYSTPVQVNVAAGLAGTYTINSAVATGGTNFQTFTAAAAALNCGIIAPVTINVVPGSGPYTETFNLTAIGGASAINKVRINGNGETIQFNGTATTNMRIVSLDGTKYVTIDSLTIKSLNASYGWGIHIAGTAERDSILRCTVDMSSITGTSSINGNGIVMSGSNLSSATSASSVKNIYLGKNKVIAGSANASGGCYYGITFTGSSSAAPNDSIYIVNNEVTNFFYYGIRAAYNKGGEISYNNVHRTAKTVSTATSAYGIYYYYGVGVKCMGNKVHDMAAPGVSNTNSLYGIYNYHYNNTATTPILVANNIVYNLGTYSGSQYLMYCYGPSLKVYHNTVDASAVQGTTASTMYGMYVGYNTGSEFKNNIINITGGNGGTKYGIYHSSTTYAATYQKNNIYVNSTQSGTQIPYYYGVSYTTLAAFQAAYPAQEVGSPNTPPQFTSPATGNLTPASSALINTGTNVFADVPTDINGLSRSATPTIGAFEFLPAGANDGKSVTFISPTGTYCANTNTPVKVVIGNAGSNTITNMTVNWKLNGTTMTAYNWTGTLVAPGSPSGNTTDTIVLGTVSLPAGSSNIVVWVTSPNGQTDPVQNNDTISWAANSALPGGIYTINAGAPASATNFTSFTGFKNALAWGICGPVVANVVAGSGPYNEMVEFPNVAGSSAVNTIRINGNGEILQYNVPNANILPIFSLNNTKYFTLNNLKIKALNNTYGWGILLTGDSSRDSIVNCEVDLSTITGTSSVNANGIVISGSNTSPTTSASVTHINIRNNKVIAGSTSAGGAYYGITFTGISSAAPNDSIYIVGNEVSNFYYYGIRAYYNKGGEISYNNVHRSSKATTNTSAYGIYYYYGQGIKCIGNKVHDMAMPGVNNTNYLYGIYNYHYNNTTATPNLIANNILYNLGNYSGTQYLMYVYGPAHNVYHNTVDVSALQSNTGGGTIYGIYYGYNNGSNFKNNIINITGGSTGIKYGFYGSSTSYTADLQKNNVYVSSTQTGAQYPYYYGTAYTTLAAFQTAYPTQEVGSPSVDPQFISPSTGDLSPLNVALMTAGNNLQADVPADINGAARSTTPTVGAFEFNVSGTNNARALSLLKPKGNYCSGTQPVEVMIGNVGTNNINTLQINWSINGVTQTPVPYSSVLVPIGASAGQSFDTVLLGNANLIPGNNFIKAWTSLPNGQPDFFPANDTTKLTAVPATFSVTGSVSTICANDTSVLSLSPGYGYAPGSLQWEYSTNGTTWTAIPNTDTVNYKATNISTATQYRVRILSGGNNCISPSFTLNVNYVAPPTVVTAQSCSPTALTLNATPGSGNTLKWYASATSNTVLATTNSYTTPTLYATTTYYVVAVTPSGCASVRTPVNAYIHILPPVNLGPDFDTCTLNAAAFTIDPGTQHPGATYAWDDNSTGSSRSITQTGTYYVTVTDTNTCSKSDTVHVEVNPRPIVDLDADGTGFCIGATKVLDAGPDGENGGDYYWTNGATTRTITATAAGTYIVFVTSAKGCLTSDTVTLTQAGYAPTTTGILALANSPMGFTFSAVNPQNVVGYEWDFGDGTTINTQSNPSHTYAAGGYYTIKLKLSSVCADIADSSTVYILGATGTKDLDLSADAVKVYPNPSNGQTVFMEVSNGLRITEVSVLNTLGKEVYRTTYPAAADKYQLNLPAYLSSGMYQLHINTDKGATVRKIELLK